MIRWSKSLDSYVLRDEELLSESSSSSDSLEENDLPTDNNTQGQGNSPINNSTQGDNSPNNNNFQGDNYFHFNPSDNNNTYNKHPLSDSENELENKRQKIDEKFSIENNNNFKPESGGPTGS